MLAHLSPLCKIWEIALVAPVAKTHNHKPHPNICTYNEVKGGGIASYFQPPCIKKTDNWMIILNLTRITT